MQSQRRVMKQLCPFHLLDFEDEALLSLEPYKPYLEQIPLIK